MISVYKLINGKRLDDVAYEIEGGGSSSANIEESKSTTITSNGQTTIAPSDGYDGMAEVVVNVAVAGGGSDVTDVTPMGYTPDVNTVFNSAIADTYAGYLSASTTGWANYNPDGEGSTEKWGVENETDLDNIRYFRADGDLRGYTYFNKPSENAGWLLFPNMLTLGSILKSCEIGNIEQINTFTEDDKTLYITYVESRDNSDEELYDGEIQFGEIKDKNLSRIVVDGTNSHLGTYGTIGFSLGRVYATEWEMDMSQLSAPNLSDFGWASGQETMKTFLLPENCASPITVSLNNCKALTNTNVFSKTINNNSLSEIFGRTQFETIGAIAVENEDEYACVDNPFIESSTVNFGGFTGLKCYYFRCNSDECSLNLQSYVNIANNMVDRSGESFEVMGGQLPTFEIGGRIKDEFVAEANALASLKAKGFRVISNDEEI